MPPRAIVIGAGVGGCATALLLAEAGLEVTLLEKNPRIGGSCSAYEKDGFSVDIGTHLFCRGDKGPLGEVLRRVGAPGAIPFRRTRDLAELRSVGGDGRLARVAVPAAVHRLPRFAWDMARLLDLGPREALAVARLFAHILAMSEAEVAAWDHETVDTFLHRFGDHERVVGIFGFLLGLFFVLPYWRVSAGEALWCFRRLVRDHALSYPLGGSIRVPGTYADLARERGALVRTRAGVGRILVEGGAVRGVVTTTGEELLAEVVVSTSSVRTTVLHLAGRQHFPERYVRRAETLVGSAIAVQAKIGLDRPLVEAGALVGGVGERHDPLRLPVSEMAAMYGAVEAGRLPEVVPFYCPVPTNFDPSLAPEGGQLLTACALAPTTDVPLADPAPAWEEAMLRTLRQVIPGLDEHIQFVDRFSVRFIEHWIGKEYGPAISTAQTPDQVGARRPRVHTPVRGLYLAGCGAGGRGVGTELAASSALECADRILADLDRRQVARVPAPPLPVRLARHAARTPLAWATRLP